MAINQRFENLLYVNKINQSSFAELAKMDRVTVSNIANGRTKQPKSDFFEAIATHYPGWLFWILTGKDRHYPPVEGQVLEVREPKDRPAYGPAYGLAAELERLLRIVEQQSRAIEGLTAMMEALREEVRVLREKVAGK